MLSQNGIKYCRAIPHNLLLMGYQKSISVSLLIIIFFLSIPVIPAKSFLVGPNNYFKSIHSVLTAARDGDTILVEKGVYKENTLIIKKSVKIIGLGFPVLSGENKYEIMKIKSDDVLIRGFLFKDSGINFIYDNAAVKLDSVKNCIIEENIFSNNFFGIYLSRASRCKILNNQLEAFHTKETYSGNGIHLWQCRDMIIKNNTINGHRDGIYFEFVKNSEIEQNQSEANLRYGLHFMFSDSCRYAYNYFTKNGSGVAVMFTKNVDMHNNRFEYNWGGAAFGLLLKDISDSKIYRNQFLKNSCAIYFEGCNRVNTFENNFAENGSAIRLMANSIDNIFARNNFISNSFDVSTNSTRSYNSFEFNYWSEYKGYDLNNDGFGDIPHRPVKLFSIIIEKNRPALILLRSLFVDILNAAENIFPSLTPKTLLDIKPKMKKYL
jgi:nitrous oxidase accessory protein